MTSEDHIKGTKTNYFREKSCPISSSRSKSRTKAKMCPKEANKAVGGGMTRF